MDRVSFDATNIHVVWFVVALSAATSDTVPLDA